MFTVSYGAPPQLQLNAYEQPLVRKGNLKNLPSGSPLTDHENFGDFTTLFCSGGGKKCKQFYNALAELLFAGSLVYPCVAVSVAACLSSLFLLCSASEIGFVVLELKYEEFFVKKMIWNFISCV